MYTENTYVYTHTYIHMCVYIYLHTQVLLLSTILGFHLGHLGG
jgi:hypothetical protein